MFLCTFIYNHSSTIDGKDYGFYLDLYSEMILDSFRADTLADYIFIEFKKQTPHKWFRLLKSIKKCHFLKSEYDNINDASDEDDEMAAKKLDFSFNASRSERKHLGLIRTGSTDSSSTTSSLMDDQAVDDVDLDRDCLWD